MKLELSKARPTYDAQNIETNPNFQHFDNDNFQNDKSKLDNITSQNRPISLLPKQQAVHENQIQTWGLKQEI